MTEEHLFGCHGYTCVSWAHLLLPVCLRCYSGEKNTTPWQKHRENWVLMKISVPLDSQQTPTYTLEYTTHTHTHTEFCVYCLVSQYSVFTSVLSTLKHIINGCSAHTSHNCTVRDHRSGWLSMRVLTSRRAFQTVATWFHKVRFWANSVMVILTLAAVQPWLLTSTHGPTADAAGSDTRIKPRWMFPIKIFPKERRAPSQQHFNPGLCLLSLKYWPANPVDWFQIHCMLTTPCGTTEMPIISFHKDVFMNRVL